MVEGYCVKCNKKHQIKGVEETRLSNGKPAIKGTCPACGTKIFKIVKAKKEES